MSYKEQILSKAEIPQGKLLLAFSGGSDSLALLALLPKERSKAIYINHNIRSEEELEKEIELNKKNAMRFNIPLEIVTIERGRIEELQKKEKISLEAAARKLRYEILLAQNADYILTAHHLDDQAETLIMRFLDNSPLYRLEGIKKQNGKIFRPLLAVSKALINAYLKEEGLLFSTDSTNNDVLYKRNYIRKYILPSITEDQKRLLLNISLNVQEINKRDDEIVLEKGECYEFSRSLFLSSSLMRKEEVFFKINRDLGYDSRLPRSKCFEMIDSIEKGKGYFFERFTIKVDSDRVYVFKKGESLLFDGSHSFSYGQIEYIVADDAYDEKTLEIDFSSLRPPIILRTSKETDEIVLKEGRKKLKELHKEYRIPYSFVLEDRDGIVAVFCRIFSKKDRIARRMRGKSGVKVSLKALKCLL